MGALVQALTARAPSSLEFLLMCSSSNTTKSQTKARIRESLIIPDRVGCASCWPRINGFVRAASPSKPTSSNSDPAKGLMEKVGSEDNFGGIIQENLWHSFSACFHCTPRRSREIERVCARRQLEMQPRVEQAKYPPSLGDSHVFGISGAQRGAAEFYNGLYPLLAASIN